MLLKAIGILLLISAIASARNVASDEYSDDSGEYDEYTDLLLKNVEAGGESGEKKGYKVCQTDNCKIIAKELKGGMNTSADPCVNFYDYVCGAWNDRLNLIPPYERSWGMVELFQHTVYKRIRDILETDLEPTDILPVRQAKIWYAACMNEEERKKRGIKPIESILMQTGGWPMVLNPDEWFEDDFSWQELEKSYFYVTGDLVFYNIRPSWSANENGTASHIEIRDAVSPLGQRMHYGITDEEAEESWKKYKPFVKRVAKEFIKHNKAEVPEEVIDNDIDGLIEFERKLYNFGNMHESSLLTTIGDFVDEYHENVTDISGDNTIHFEQLFSAIFSMVGFRVDRDQELEVERPHFYIHLTELLSKTPKRTIANYIHWCFVSKAISYTTEAMNAIWNEEVEEGTGIETNPPKWLQCVKDVKMEHAASYVFATKYFTKWTEKYVSDMIENIRQQLTLQIETANWVNEKERDLMMKRLNSIEVLIGFPDWYKNETVIKTAYKGLKVGHQHFDNMLNWDKYKIREELRFMKEKRKEEPWDIQPILVNAVYSPYENKINVPAADFQPPLFTPELPDTVNYGIVGCIIGHEIGHAYDNNGIQFLTPDEDDLPDHLIENYFKRAECFIHQYNDYFGVTESFIEGSTPPFYEEMGSVGRRTRGENIADTTGLHAVFEAWRKLDSKKETEDIKLPGFEDYTDEQMFFIGFASAMCGVQKPEFKKMLEKYDSHSLRNIRVIGSVSNTKEFARVFSCSENSPMNPEDKCQIWKSPEESNEIPKRRRREHRRHIWSLTDW